MLIRCLMVMLSLADLGIPDVDDAHDFRECCRAFAPTPQVRSLPWAEENIFTEAGKPYDHALFPHIGAPGGPMDAFDDLRVRTIALQWGVRLGKSFFGQVETLKTAATDPAPMMFVSSREKLAREITERTYVMIRSRPALRRLLVKDSRLQKQDLIEFRGCKMFVGWAKSASTLADKNIKVGHANEIDKWERPSTSTEGDPLDLFADRFNDYHISRKVIYESTPSVKGKSRIERLRLAGSNCEYWVPCPHCKCYQVIEFGSPDHKHGIKWDRGPDGRSDPDIAKKTARYVCRHCSRDIDSQERHWMFRRGVWIPEGCRANDERALAIAEGEPYEWSGWAHASWITGSPVRDGEDASYQLPSLYALKIPDWGDFAKRFVKAADRPQSLRTFINQWLAKTWEISAKQQTWEALGKRLIVEHPRGNVPDVCSLVTLGVDKQLDHYVYVVEAWGVERTSHTLAYGECDIAELEELICRKWPGAGRELAAKQVLIDCGFRPTEVHEFIERCRKLRFPVQACRGSSSPLDAYYARRQNGAKTSNPGKWIVWVDASLTQDFIDRQLHTLQAGDKGSTTLFAGSLGEHQDFLEQLLNDAPVAGLDSHNKIKESWDRIDENIPNDYRDAKRYAFVAMLLHTRGAPLKTPGTRPVAAAKPATPAAPARPRFRMSDRPGRPRLS